MPDAPFSLLAASPADLRREGLPRALASALGLTSIDVGILLRRSRGILRENLPRAEADRIAGLLGDVGVGTLVLPGAGVAALPPARAVARMEPAPEGIRAVLRGGGGEVIPWERLAGLSFGWWAAASRTTETRGPEGPSAGEMAARAGFMVVTGLPIGLGRKGKPEPRTVVRTEFRILLDLLLDGPEERLRVDGENSDFSGLGAAMAPTGLANVRALAAALAAAVPGASRNAGADLLVGGGRLSAIGYESEADFLREQRWLRAVRKRDVPN